MHMAAKDENCRRFVNDGVADVLKVVLNSFPNDAEIVFLYENGVPMHERTLKASPRTTTLLCLLRETGSANIDLTHLCMCRSRTYRSARSGTSPTSTSHGVDLCLKKMVSHL